MQDTRRWNNRKLIMNSGSHGGEYEDGRLLCYKTGTHIYLSQYVNMKI
jgi:hypothetical protein